MKETVRQKLLHLNLEFYTEFVAPFIDTRMHPQNGFAVLLDDLPLEPFDLLDVGCANGRLGVFFQKHNRLAAYSGVDFSAAFLEVAQNNMPGTYFQRNMAEPNFLEGVGKHDVVACLAAMQHIPGYERRVALLRELAACLRDPNSRLVLSNWQFMNSERQRRKVRDWGLVGLSAEELDPNDYLLVWNRNGETLRYVCFINEEETERMAQDAGLRIVRHFYSDGREGNLSLYTVLALPEA